ncbi:MAG TPA: metallophosphoesterase [Polyangiales bacterium]|nr:metallophosphoesterase [Polyangiales bacterium]
MRRILPVLLVVGTFFGLLLWAHAYFAQRLLVAPRVPEPFRSLGAYLLLALAASIFVNPTVDRYFGPKAARPIAWVAYVWMGSAFYLLLALWTSDLLLFAAGLSSLAVERTRALVVLAVTTCVVVLGMFGALRPAAIKRVALALPGWPRALDGYRVLQISDIHIGSLLQRRYAARLVAQCNAERPDLLAITGDLVDGSAEKLREQTAPFGDLRARDGVYFITGNHEYFSGDAPWVRRVAELGIRVLRNERIAIARDGAGFELAGVDDYGSHRRAPNGPGFDLDATLAGWQPSTPLILLSHDPRAFDLARARGVQLQLSGHTHDGQMWPFRYLVRLQTRYLAGTYRDGASILYVSRGTGFWGPPLRVLAPAEITELTLRSAP